MDETCGQSSAVVASPVKGNHMIKKYSTNLTACFTMVRSISWR